MRAEYPAVERRTVFVSEKRRPRVGRKAALTRLNALERTPSVTIGRRPLTWDAKAYFTTEETRNLELPVGESSPSRAGRMSRQRTSSWQHRRVLDRRVAGHTPIEVPETQSVQLPPGVSWTYSHPTISPSWTVYRSSVYVSKRSPVGPISRFARHSPDVARERFAFAHSRRFDAGEPPVVGFGDSVGPKHVVPVGQDPTEAAVAVGNRPVAAGIVRYSAGDKRRNTAAASAAMAHRR